jgi:uncharacterized protein YhfF
MSERRERFGHTAELQDALAALIVAGKKCATSSLRRWYDDGTLPLPRVGETWIVEDGSGRACCRCRTTHVEVRPFGQVDESHARAEGEDDGSLASWQAIHREFFGREADEHGFVFDDESLVVLERFERLPSL